MSEWMGWLGGECPVDEDVVVEVVRRDGRQSDPWPAGALRWTHIDHYTDIVRYRVRDAAPVDPLSDSHEALTFGPLSTTKDTNPKDVIGAKKAKISVIPSGVMFELGLAMLEGACKYGRHNYRVAGVRASVYYDATMGHLMDFWEGQDIDPDSGRSHLVKAMASLAVWIDAIQQGMLTDDRPPRSKVTKADFNDAAAAIIERHADKSPKHYTIADTRPAA